MPNSLSTFRVFSPQFQAFLTSAYVFFILSQVGRTCWPQNHCFCFTDLGWFLKQHVLSFWICCFLKMYLWCKEKCFSTVQFSHSVMSDSLWPHGLQHARLPYTSLTPGACLNSCPSSQWCHPTNSSFVVPFSSFLQSFQASGSFPLSLLRIRWPKYWSFSFNVSPSNEYSELTSFQIYCFDLRSPRDSQESSPTPLFKSINSLALKFFYTPTLTSICDY